MRRAVTVSVPYSRKLPYTLYAKGSLTAVPHVDDGADFVHFTFGCGTVFVLFYTFAGFRRAYIAACWESSRDGEGIMLPGVSERLCLIFTARGRKIDDLKRVLYILADEQGGGHKVFSLPLLFWYRLAALIQHSGAARSDVAVLWEQFTGRRLKKLPKKGRSRTS